MVHVGSVVFLAIGLLTLSAGAVHILIYQLMGSARWRWWAVGISVVCCAFSVAVAIQLSAGPTHANVIADRVSFASLFLLVVFLVGLTFAYWDAPHKIILLFLIPVHIILAAVALFTDLVAVSQFERRTALPLFGGDYWEALPGPLLSAFSVYLLVAALASLIAWLALTRRRRRGSGLFLAGYGMWFGLAVLDVVSNTLGLALPPTTAFGFLVLTLLLLFMAVEDIRSFQKRVQSVQRRYKTITEYSRDIVVLLDADFSLLYANPAASHVTGYSEVELTTGAAVVNAIHSNGMPPAGWRSSLLTLAT